MTTDSPPAVAHDGSTARRGLPPSVVFALLWIGAGLVYWFTGQGPLSIQHPSPYPSYWYLAEAFLDGRLGFAGNPGGLELLAGRYGLLYVTNPPVPALLCIPAVLLNLSQRFVCCVIAGLAVALVYRRWGLWHALLLGFGTPFWYLASVGSVWYFAQVSAVFFVVAALCTRSPLAAGLLLGASYWSRFTMLGYLPYLVYKHRKNWAEVLVGVGVFAFANVCYNMFRFEQVSFWMTLGPPVGYYEGVQEFKHGLKSFSYIPQNLDVMLAAWPRFQSSFPWVFPLVGGTAIWVLTPALFLVRGFWSRERLLLWLSIGLVMLPNLTHPTPGFTQLGYRYFIDAMPLVLCLMRAPRRLAWGLLGLSILFNLWSVLALNVFGVFQY